MLMAFNHTGVEKNCMQNNLGLMCPLVPELSGCCDTVEGVFALTLLSHTMTKPQEASAAWPSHVPWLCRCVTLATTFVITSTASHSLHLAIKIRYIIRWHLSWKGKEFCRHCREKEGENTGSFEVSHCFVPWQNHKILQEECAVWEVAIKEEKSFRSQKKATSYFMEWASSAL